MKILKIETNIKRNLYLNQSTQFNFKNSSSSIENEIIEIYPNIEAQTIIGFGAAITRKFCLCIIKCKYRNCKSNY